MKCQQIQLLTSDYIRLLNPILHGNGPKVPTDVNDLSQFFGKCFKWAHFSWLCFCYHLLGPSNYSFRIFFSKFWKIRCGRFFTISSLSAQKLKKLKKNVFDLLNWYKCAQWYFVIEFDDKFWILGVLTHKMGLMGGQMGVKMEKLCYLNKVLWVRSSWGYK